jgi:hypothetical protein
MMVCIVMVSFKENPKKMMIIGGTPASGNLQILQNLSRWIYIYIQYIYNIHIHIMYEMDNVTMLVFLSAKLLNNGIWQVCG